MMGILNPLNSESYQLGFRKELAATAGERFVNWAKFMCAESHGIYLACKWNEKTWHAPDRGGVKLRDGLLQSCSEEDQ